MSGQKPPIYWESPDEIEKIQKRRVIRQRLQTEFNRIAYNPYNLHNHVEFLDPSVSRYMAMRSSIYEYWKPNWRAFIKWSLLTYVPIILGAMQLKRQFIEIVGPEKYHMRKEISEECEKVLSDEYLLKTLWNKRCIAV